MLTSLRATVVYVPACFYVRVFTYQVSACQIAKSMPVSHFYLSTCQCAMGVLIFKLSMPTCKKACNTFKHSYYKMVRKNSINNLLYRKFHLILNIIVMHMVCICIVHKNCIILHFYTSCYIIEKSVEFIFLWFFSFCFLVTNENIKRPGFYTLHLTRIFSNIPQLKQLNNINNTCEYCDLLELKIWDSYKKPCYDSVSFRLLRICSRVL